MDHPQLTARQAEILDVVIDGIATHHVPPTVREIGEEVGMSSPSSVKYQLDALEEKGYISRNPRRPRMIELTEAGRDFPDDWHIDCLTNIHRDIRF